MLSKGQQLLLDYLKSISMQEEAIKITMIAVKKPEDTDKLIQYIIKNKNNEGKVDKDQLVEEAMRIGTQQ